MVPWEVSNPLRSSAAHQVLHVEMQGGRVHSGAPRAGAQDPASCQYQIVSYNGKSAAESAVLLMHNAAIWGPFLSKSLFFCKYALFKERLWSVFGQKWPKMSPKKSKGDEGGVKGQTFTIFLEPSLTVQNLGFCHQVLVHFKLCKSNKYWQLLSATHCSSQESQRQVGSACSWNWELIVASIHPYLVVEEEWEM